LFSRNEGSEVLQWASANAPTKSKSGLIEFSRSLTHQFTLQFAVKFKETAYRKRMEYTIATSGLGAELNVDEFIGMKILWGVLFPVLLLILNFALQMGYPFYLFILMAPLGWQLPSFYARSERGKRVLSVLADLPFFIDLLSLSVEAGLDFQGSIQRITEKSRGDSVLADEFDNVLRDITLGSSPGQALKAMAFRLDMPEVNSFVNVVVDAYSTGASIVKVLKDQSVQMRLERFVRAEKAGAKASQAILIPLMLFIIPAVFIMVFAPVALQFMYGNSK
jgi:tight adherence protein C